MKNSWWNRAFPLFLLSIVLIQCGRSKSATSNTNNQNQITVSPNNAPNQAELDSIKQIETLKKEQASPIVPPK